MVGLSLHDPLLTVVGLLGALFHLLNHALFKGLLFLGAGAIISRLHTHDMEKMGALAKRMPWTAAACLIGCLAISAIPPLNGFISEWYTWQSLFSLSRVEAVALQLAGPIAMVMLAVTGGLAVMCFVKMYGITFCGAPRSTHAGTRAFFTHSPCDLAWLQPCCACMGLLVNRSVRSTDGIWKILL